MRFFSIIAYIISAVCLYMGLLIGWVNSFKSMYIWDPSAFLFIIAGFTLSIINFKFSEITRAVKNAISNSAKSYENLDLDKQVLQTIWKYLFLTSVFLLIPIMVIILSNLHDTTKLGPSLAIISITPLYAFILKFFVFMPLEISLEKKIIQIKLQQNPVS